MILKSTNNIKSHISACNNYLKSLTTLISGNEMVVLWFQGLCKNLTNIILEIGRFNRDLEGKLEKGHRDNLLLYLSQLLTSLSLLINVFIKESEAQQVLSEARLSAKKQIAWCLDGIQEILSSSKDISDPSGSFIKWMDSALEKIAEIDLDKGKDAVTTIFNDAKELFEEVLCHAMSIAQVALEEDCKIIRGSSQTVLDSLDMLTKEMDKKILNPPMINLFVDSCTDKLCALERRVNTAVLKLCLKVFSEYTAALEEIHEFCFNDENTGKTEELDSLVVDFDLHVDRIMQIGLFAVSCSTSSKRAIKIRSCLASLEALECELVPAFTSVILDKSVPNVSLALLLKNHWLQQANILRRDIFLIVDPFAFCQVIFEENKQIVDDIADIIKSENLTLHEKLVEPLINQSFVLQEFVSIILKEDTEMKNIECLTEKLSDFKNVLHEVKYATNIFLSDEKSRCNYYKLLKRCKILLATTKQVWHCFLDENFESKSKTSLDLQEETSHLTGQTITGNQFLDHIIKRGKQILKDRSILYKSSMKNNTFSLLNSKGNHPLKRPNKSVPLSKLVHIRKLSFMNSVEKTDAAELQMTDILNELDNLTDTFTK
ncbi:hypothetical protein NQ315_010464 [Exocentrus adspersus]|uniref:Serendipity locus protein alpha n=1 Tax=Exocentrus adspersus TaxID=1586481 RepID=A0AAV8W560_9CUCU|nr:hypothetical protein NQ315_010464 [Exocentrus adspersus]